MVNCANNRKECNSECCGLVPIPKGIYTAFPKIRHVTEELFIEEDNTVIGITEDATCPFLGYDLQCSIYAIRPEVCKLFGEGNHPFLICPYNK